jgi:hypothetical protein
MLKVTHKQLNVLLKQHYYAKLPLLVLGGFGIGKSFVVRDSSIELATEFKRVFKNWGRTTEEEKEEIFKNPSKYFVLIDERLAENDTTDIKGLPYFKGEDTIEWKIPRWAKFLSLEDSNGVVFFDELNLAPPIVQGSVYKIVYDRVVGNTKINNNWGIFMAGNRDGVDKAFTHTIPAPLKDRCSEVELTISNVEDWTDWASKHNIDSRVITFVNFKPSSLYVVDYNDNQKYTTTRGWERVNILTNGKKIDENFELVVCSTIGEGIAREFLGFCRLKDKYDLENLIKNPKGLKDITDISVKYLFVGSVADLYKDDKIGFDKVKEVSGVLDECNNAEFVTLLWKLCINYNSEKFRKDFKKNNDVKFAEKYFKYLL